MKWTMGLAVLIAMTGGALAQSQDQLKRDHAYCVSVGEQAYYETYEPVLPPSMSKRSQRFSGTINGDWFSGTVRETGPTGFAAGWAAGESDRAAREAAQGYARQVMLDCMSQRGWELTP